MSPNRPDLDAVPAFVHVSEEVAAALDRSAMAAPKRSAMAAPNRSAMAAPKRSATAQAPVVALESTIFSRLGLPAPHNRVALEACHQEIRDRGAVPAMIAVIDGVVRVGVEPEHHDRVLAATNKIAKRDLAAAVATGLDVGVTTVSATVTVAATVGITCFATGGIGGVHRNRLATGDVSADLDAIASSPVIVVCSGAKSFLDIGQTLEYLETQSVPVLGWQTERFPAFTAADSGYRVPRTVNDGVAVAELARLHWTLGGAGIVVAVPPPEPIDEAQSNEAIVRSERAADDAGITGAARTPYVLEKMAEITGGATVASNIALARNNASVAAQIAVSSPE